MDYNLQVESNKISLEHMTSLAVQYRDINHIQFITHMEEKPREFNKNFELNILRGSKVGPKECYVKHNFFPDKKLEYQFDIINNKMIFNQSTRQKLK